jgi:hypothetical protein
MKMKTPVWFLSALTLMAAFFFVLAIVLDIRVYWPVIPLFGVALGFLFRVLLLRARR